MAHSHNIIVKKDGYQSSGDPAHTIEGFTTSGSFYSAPIPIKRKSGFSATLSCPSTGSPVGHIYAQACNDEERVLDVADSNLVNWIDIPDLDSVVSGESIIVLEDRAPQYRWLRFYYARTSGSITATINLHAKQESK